MQLKKEEKPPRSPLSTTSGLQPPCKANTTPQKEAPSPRPLSSLPPNPNVSMDPPQAQRCWRRLRAFFAAPPGGRPHVIPARITQPERSPPWGHIFCLNEPPVVEKSPASPFRESAVAAEGWFPNRVIHHGKLRHVPETPSRCKTQPGSGGGGLKIPQGLAKRCQKWAGGENKSPPAPARGSGRDGSTQDPIPWVLSNAGVGSIPA